MTAITFGSRRWDTRPRSSLLPADWPIVLICAGMPLCFVIGIHGFIWALPAVVFGLQLFSRREPIIVPRSSIPLLLLVAWIPVTMLRLEASALPLAAFRFLVFASTAACFLWLVNQPERLLPTRRVVRLLATLWVVLVAFGYLAVLLPTFSMPSPFQSALPGGILSNVYIVDLTSWRFAQVESLVSIEVGRPAAPMAYSNGWGSTLGLLTPFFVLEYFVLSTGRRRRIGMALGAAGLVPIILSLNRGLWVSMGVGFLYVAVRRALQGNLRIAIAVVVAAVLVVGVLAATALGDTVQQRFEISSDSNNARTALYEVAYDTAQQSPLLGWGAPVDVAGLWKEVGTHGLVWFVMVAYGFPGLFFLLAWMVFLVASSARAPNAIALWAHVAIVVFIVQTPVYGLLPQVVLVGIAAAIAMRGRDLTEVSA
jgi:polysaccharide biosynthesis protein PslJ